MKNPWNVIMEVNFDDSKKIEILNWYNNIIKYHPLIRKRKIEDKPLGKEYCDYLQKIYNEGYGYKIIARWLGISYTRLRTLFIKYLELNVRKGQRICTIKTKEFRSKRVMGSNNPWYDWPDKKPLLIKDCSRGIQGYYLRDNRKYIWLRSSWEYIYAKWLEKNNISWDYEVKSFKLPNGETYKPDFKIYGEQDYFVEIKGSLFNHRLYKIDLFKKEYPHINIIVIKNIDAYTEIGYKKELKQWKKVRLLEKK